MTILQSLAHRYERLSDELANPGLSPENIGFEIVLGADGTLHRMSILGDPHSKPPHWRVIHVPTIERTSGIEPGLLWDKTAYMLGVVGEEINVDGRKALRPIQRKRTAEEHTEFVKRQCEAVGDSDDVGLQAVLAFYEAWTPDRFEAEGHDPRVLNLNGVFRLEGDIGSDGRPRFIHQRPAAIPLWLIPEDRPNEGSMRCLITGHRTFAANTHLKIKGVRDAQSSGASIVSFNAPAYESRGHKQAANAPVSPRAMHAYRTALNALLAKNSGRSARIGDTTVVFWAETVEGAPALAEERVVGGAVFDTGWGELSFSDPLAEQAGADGEAFDADREEKTRLKDIVLRIAEGQEIAPRLANVDSRARVHVLGLSPNNARLAVRFWYVGSLGELARNVSRHWENMRLEPDPYGPLPPAAWMLAREAAQHVLDENTGRWTMPKAAAPPSRLAGELLSAILEGAPYPGSLLAMLLMRVRAERGRVTARRAGLLKAIYNRNVARVKEEELPLGLEKDRADPAYRLGRLFALYEWAEDAASGGRTATLRDRYFAAASATPERVFGTLGISYGHDLAKVRKSERVGFAVRLDQEVADVMGGLPADIPRTFGSEDQAQFIVGYYHQKQARFAGKDGRAAPDDDAPEDETLEPDDERETEE